MLYVRILSIASVYGAYLENCTVHRGDIKPHFSQMLLILIRVSKTCVEKIP